MRITIDIPVEQEVAFVTNFLRKEPIPLEEGGQPLFTAEGWIKEVAVRRLNSVAALGARLIYEEGFVPPEDVVRNDIENRPLL